MSNRNKKTVYVIGDRMPNADSICSSIALARLRNTLVESDGDPALTPSYSGATYKNVRFTAVRCGSLDKQTKYILNRFGFRAPALLTDARTQVQDVRYSKTIMIEDSISLLEAWNIMQNENKAALAITDDEGLLKGIITKGDIAKSYMEVFDTEIIGRAHTPFKNILDVLQGRLVVGDPDGYVESGKVVVAAANTELLSQTIEEGDVVILSNRYEAQLCAVEQHASVIIVDNSAPVSRTIKKLASENGCAIISTDFDGYDTARLINQSLPVGYFMTTKLTCFTQEDFIDDIRPTMTKMRFRDFPIVTKKGYYAGMISRRNLIDMDKKRFIMVNHNSPENAIPGIGEAEISEIVDHHPLGTVETIKPLIIRERPTGSTAAIVAQMYEENAVDISPMMAGMLCAAILSATDNFGSQDCSPVDTGEAQKLAEKAGVNMQELADALDKAGAPDAEETGRKANSQGGGAK